MIRFAALTSTVALVAAGYLVAAEPPATERYPIQSGDDLSTVSKTLFGDKNYWPRAWSKKKQAVPHLVEQGHSIQFLLGNEETAPAFAISESDDAGPVMESPAALRRVANTSGGEVEIPPPRVKPAPVLRLGPDLMPEWQKLRGGASNFRDFTIEVYPRKPVNPETSFIVPVYVQDSELVPVGELVNEVSESHLAHDGESVFVRVKPGTGQIGAQYLLLSDAGKLQKSNFLSISGVKYTGYVIRVMAEITLVSTAETDGDGGWDHFRARIDKAVGVSIAGTSLVPGRLTTVSANPNGAISNISAQIIGGNFDVQGNVFGEGSWVFLNKGAKDGLQAGELVWVTSNPKAHQADTPFIVGVQNSALVRVAKVSSDVATGLVLSSKESLMQGDYSGSFNTSLSSPTAGSSVQEDTPPTSPDEGGIDTGSELDIDKGTTETPENPEQVEPL